MYPANLVKFNKLFITLCASWASLNTELDLPAGWLLRWAGRASIGWSCVIFVTSLIKFFYPSGGLLQNTTGDKTGSAHATFGSALYRANASLSHQQDQFQLTHLLTLNYLPRINSFSKLYYGLVSTLIGAPLVWRIYLNFYRPWKRSRALLSGSNLRAICAKRDLVSFFMEGPNPVQKEADKQQVKRASSNWFSSSLIVGPHERPRHQPSITKLELLGKIHQISTRRRRKPLSRIHARPNASGSYEAHPGDLGPSEQDKFYHIPVRAFDIFGDRSPARWFLLIKLVYFMCAWVTCLAIPILWLIVGGLKSVIRNFTLPIGQSSFLGRFLHFYGPLEQIYSCTQSALFFIFSNVFITLFHADIFYKWRILRRAIKNLRWRYLALESKIAASDVRLDGRDRLLNCREQIYELQLKIWTLFDQIIQIDDFVSKYSMISMVIFVIGASFGQSFIKVEDYSLKMATASVLLSSFCSFSYLYLLSWHIENLSDRVHIMIMSIVARDEDYLTKRIWQKLLVGFYGSDGKRTFTMNDKYPLNLRSYFKTVFGLATMSLVMNSLFHKRSWEKSFNLQDGVVEI